MRPPAKGQRTIPVPEPRPARKGQPKCSRCGGGLEGVRALSGQVVGFRCAACGWSGLKPEVASVAERQRAYNGGGRGVRLTVTLSPVADDLVTKLHRTGLYGMTRAAVVQGLLYEALRRADHPPTPPAKPRRRG